MIMTGSYYPLILMAWIALGMVVFFLLLFITAPYGRHLRKGWGPTVSAKIAWIIMELPAVILLPFFFYFGGRYTNLPLILFLFLWEVHYINRTFVFPFRLSPQSKPMPASIMLSGIFFNLVNCYLIGGGIFILSEEYPQAWLSDPRFIFGTGIFFTGFVINNHSDSILRSLRKPGETEYKIPQGGFYRWVACPNYLGEILEWGGFALATWSMPALAFFLWSFANLVPRAISHHKWYPRNFENYPQGWKSVIPYLL